MSKTEGERDRDHRFGGTARDIKLLLVFAKSIATTGRTPPGAAGADLERSPSQGI